MAGITARSVVDTMNKHLAELGEVEIRRCNRDTGELYDTEQKEQEATMDAADFQMRTAQLARMLSVLDPSEKLEWAAERKVEGNAFFEEKQFDKAIQRYLDACVGLDFGKTEEEAEKARTIIQIPVLTNLAACYLEKREFEKVIQLCSQAIDADPSCLKAFLRRSRAYLALGKLKLAKADIDVVETEKPGTCGPELRILKDASERRKRAIDAQKHHLSNGFKASFGEMKEDEKDEEVKVDQISSRRNTCKIFCWKVRRFLMFRVDPPIKFD